MDDSLTYNPQGGRIVLHTACDKEVATFAFGQEAQWRNGKDNRPHLYVEGNPVGFRDPSGNCPGECNYENALLFSLIYLLAEGKGKLVFPSSPGHNYSGSSNNDFKFFNKLFNKDPNQRANAYAVIGIVYSILNEEGFSQEQIAFSFAVIFLNAKIFRVRPKGVTDAVSQTHDDSAPTTLLQFGNKSDDRYHATGAGGFVRGGLDSLSSIGKWNAGDVATFSVGVPLYTAYAGIRGTMYNIKSMNLKNVHQKLPDAAGNAAVVMGAFSGNPYLMAASAIGASFIGRSPLKHSERNIKRVFKVKGKFSL
ncbi:MAG: hypothetical protein MH321_10535 [Leptospiraceae bacterium]|nr:hypothetical protein [Leptospiraceae bacterium]